MKLEVQSRVCHRKWQGIAASLIVTLILAVFVSSPVFAGGGWATLPVDPWYEPLPNLPAVPVPAKPKPNDSISDINVTAGVPVSPPARNIPPLPESEKQEAKPERSSSIPDPTIGNPTLSPPELIPTVPPQPPESAPPPPSQPPPQPPVAPVSGVASPIYPPQHVNSTGSVPIYGDNQFPSLNATPTPGMSGRGPALQADQPMQGQPAQDARLVEKEKLTSTFEDSTPEPHLKSQLTDSQEPSAQAATERDGDTQEKTKGYSNIPVDEGQTIIDYIITRFLGWWT